MIASERASARRATGQGEVRGERGERWQVRARRAQLTRWSGILGKRKEGERALVRRLTIRPTATGDPTFVFLGVVWIPLISSLPGCLCGSACLPSSSTLSGLGRQRARRASPRSERRSRRREEGRATSELKVALFHSSLSPLHTHYLLTISVRDPFHAALHFVRFLRQTLTIGEETL